MRLCLMQCELTNKGNPVAQIPLTVQERIAQIRAKRFQALKNLTSTNNNSDQGNSASTNFKGNTQSNESSIPESISKALAFTSSHFSPDIVLNERQQQAVDLAISGQSFCLCGAAGTGKTTTTRAIIDALLNQSHRTFMASTKYINAGSPAIVVTAFTRRATKNAADAIDNQKITAVNFHKLLQYEPTFYEIENEDTGDIKKTMRFEPRYHSMNPLPRIQTIIIDESSQFSIPMYEILMNGLGANSSNTQFIFIGDIQQIPPVMGTSIYGPKLIELPSVELTHVYRQALESPIIRFLTDMRSGVPITRNDWRKYSRKDNDERDERFRIGIFPPKCDWEDALHQAASFLREEYTNGTYDPYSNMVLVPFNVKFGTALLNNAIAEMLDRAEHRIIHQIICGWQRKHFTVGDYVLFNTQAYVIKSIQANPKYTGSIDPINPSQFIDRTGAVLDRANWEKEQLAYAPDLDLDSDDVGETQIYKPQETMSAEDFIRLKMGLGITEDSKEEKSNSASHILELQSLDDPEEQTTFVQTVGDMMNLHLSYALTVYKAQGLQADRVYFFLHSSHSPQHFRELIYTAISRAKTYVTIICDPKTLTRGIETQRIPGSTLEEKKEHFKRILDMKESNDTLEPEDSEE